MPPYLVALQASCVFIGLWQGAEHPLALLRQIKWRVPETSTLSLCEEVDGIFFDIET